MKKIFMIMLTAIPAVLFAGNYAVQGTVKADEKVKADAIQIVADGKLKYERLEDGSILITTDGKIKEALKLKKTD